jgi:selenocysteine lyase/cysteine desulfurase
MNCQRQHFTLPEGVHYLNCAYMGPLPRAAQEAGVAGIMRKAAPLDIAPADFFTDADAARALFARILGAADARRVAILPAVSYGAAIVARNTVCRAGQRIVIAAEQFPSNVYAWRRLARERGAEVHAVARPAGAACGAAWNDAILAAIDERTALVALPHVHWTDGTRFDLESIGERARAAGAAFVIDATQSLGAMEFALERVRPDAVICAAYKWLLGPYGLAFGWLGPRFDDGVPLEETWIGRDGSEDFQQLVEYRDAYQPGAVRYDVGERSNFVLLPMAVAAMQLVADWGAAAIQDYCDRTFGRVIDEARGLGFDVEPRAWRGAHLFGVRVPAGADLAALAAALRERRVYASLRGTALRVAPNVYNDEADAAALLDALRDAAPGRPRLNAAMR